MRRTLIFITHREKFEVWEAVQEDEKEEEEECGKAERGEKETSKQEELFGLWNEPCIDPPPPIHKVQ